MHLINQIKGADCERGQLALDPHAASEHCSFLLVGLIRMLICSFASCTIVICIHIPISCSSLSRS